MDWMEFARLRKKRKIDIINYLCCWPSVMPHIAEIFIFKSLIGGKGKARKGFLQKLDVS